MFSKTVNRSRLCAQAFAVVAIGALAACDGSPTTASKITAPVVPVVAATASGADGATIALQQIVYKVVPPEEVYAQCLEAKHVSWGPQFTQAQIDCRLIARQHPKPYGTPDWEPAGGISVPPCEPFGFDYCDEPQ